MGRSSRRRAREVAFQALYLMDIGGADAPEALEDVLQGAELEEKARDYATRLFFGTCEHLKTIDSRIATHAHGYTLYRLAAVDRALLRLGIFEILFEPDVPPAVAINEIVEMAKKYSTEDSAPFLNGILGAIVREENLDPHKPRESQNP